MSRPKKVCAGLEKKSQNLKRACLFIKQVRVSKQKFIAKIQDRIWMKHCHIKATDGVEF